MKIILLSGGSGQRLWPLSNDWQSKQFLQILDNSNGGKESMVQRVWKQLTKTGLANEAYVSTSGSQVEILKDEINIQDSHIIVEPEHHDTYAAISLATLYLIHKQPTLNEPIIVLPVDPFVDDQYFENLKTLADVAKDGLYDLTLMGIKPTFASPKYGYIVPNIEQGPLQNDNRQGFKVKEFREKPDEETATAFISQGALWNAGIFAFMPSVILNDLKQKGLPTDYQSALTRYQYFPRKSFDYEFVEEQESIGAIAYEGTWKDLGTWNVLTTELSQREYGNAIGKLDVGMDTFVFNFSQQPVAVMGVKDVIVVSGPDGVLVTTKQDSPRIKELGSTLFSNPKYRSGSWGDLRVHTSDMDEVQQASLSLNAESEVPVKFFGNLKKVLLIDGSAEILDENNQVVFIMVKNTVVDLAQFPSACVIRSSSHAASLLLFNSKN